jgi:hypothetical protein
MFLSLEATSINLSVLRKNVNRRKTSLESKTNFKEISYYDEEVWVVLLVKWSAIEACTAVANHGIPY